MVTRWKIAGAALALAGTSGCAVVRPLIDRDMSNAPRTACASLGANRSERDCFVLAEEDAAGARRGWSGGALTAGRTLVAIYRPAEGCAGSFSHFTVSGDTGAAGRATLSVWDALARPGRAREVDWDAASGKRILVLGSIASATLNPAGARLQVAEGSFTPDQLCFRSY